MRKIFEAENELKESIKENATKDDYEETKEVHIQRKRREGIFCLLIIISLVFFWAMRDISSYISSMGIYFTVIASPLLVIMDFDLFKKTEDEEKGSEKDV